MASQIGRKNLRAARRRQVLSLFAVLAAVLVPAAIAWACNPQAYLRLDQSSYAPGSQMQVSGAFFKSNAQLTLSLEPGGEVARITTSGNGSFTTTVAAPSAPGSYTISAVGYEPDGTVTNGLPARASFTVAAAESRPAPGSSPQQGASQPQTSQPGAAAPSPGRFAEPEVPRARAFSTPGRRAAGDRRPATRTGGGERAAAVNTGAGVIPAAGSSAPVFAGSVARADRVAATSGGRSAAANRARDGRAGSSSAQSALGEDAWSGFDSAQAPGLTGGGNAVSDGGAGSQLGWGLGLLALGLLALVAGLTVAEVRRRRAT